MTFREILIDVFEAESDPHCALAGGLNILRTGVQGEPATAEGVVASAAKWQEHYGKVNYENILKWLEDLKGVADLEIPNQLLVSIVEARD